MLWSNAHRLGHAAAVQHPRLLPYAAYLHKLLIYAAQQLQPWRQLGLQIEYGWPS